MRILVTGASGFIGAHLVRRLAGEGHLIAVLPSPYFRAGRLAGLDYDRVDSTAGAELVYHLSMGEPIAAPNARRVVFTGSGAEYGSGHGWCEEDETRPDSDVGRTKCAIADSLRHGSVPLVHLRLFTPFGPGEAPTRLIPSVLAGRPLRTTGEQTRDYVYIDDVIDALVEAGRRPIEHGTAINICSGVPRTARQVAETIAGRVIPGDAEPEAPKHMSGSPELAKRLLGWTPRITFEEGIQRCLAA